MKLQSKAYIYALSAILCWSTVATAFKIALVGMDFMHLLLISSAVAMLFLGSLLLFSSQLKKAFSGTKKDYLRSASLGFLNPFLYYLVLLKAYSIIPAQFALSLNYIWPITLVLLSIPLLKQRIGYKSILCILLSFSGVLVIANKGSFTSIETPNNLGVLLALVSSIFWALYWIFNVRDQREEKEKLFLNFVFGFGYTLLFISFFGEFQLPNTKSILATIYIGLVECGLAYLFWLKAMKSTSSTDKISNLVFLSPFISMFFLYLIIGESIYISTLVGLGLIILGIVLQKFVKKANSIE
ncbi:DMT family transporter [Labilibaculum sp. DW002]|uniref:DMT family transporter n=1 Tax=Paralabilibaculum antarcticum TaxID=2912572 RepID=A0ABT5VSE1_9BACT|nr:DMT family transporter [Labilibaculum sp. DW002]MDE5418338.1 DMT family transporter [Labilibaculum sp. DW002]